ncbi:ABC transporter FUM19 [Fusarium oxysporum f. sp. albedinis]|nr:ABC transporter FUM19 [Fusarium oxysporum f. sp. albedinis]
MEQSSLAQRRDFINKHRQTSREVPKLFRPCHGGVMDGPTAKDWQQWRSAMLTEPTVTIRSRKPRASAGLCCKSSTILAIWTKQRS